MMRRFNMSEWAVTHPAFVLFLILSLIVGGVFSFFRLGRSEDPAFTIKVAVIQAIWPGSTAAEMQEQVSERIERKLQELPYFYRVRTFTKPGFAALTMEFRDNTPPREVPHLFYQIRKKLDDLQPELPRGLLPLRINDEFGDVDSILYTISGKGADYAQMKAVAEALKKRLLRVESVVKVNIYGAQAEKIFVEFNHARLATLGIAPQVIFESLQRQNAVVPAGVIETNAQRVPLRVSGALDGAAAVAETPIAAGGRVFRLGDIATITRGFEDPPTYILRQRGEPALAVGVVMQRGANVIQMGKNVERALDAFLRELPQGFEIERIADQPKVVVRAIDEFLSAFGEALAIVLVVTLLSLGWRTGIVVAASVPLVLSVVVMVMHAMGIDLHRITLGALIIALGLLVDDAIIAVEMMVVKMEQGWDRIKAASYAWTSTAFPMLTGTLVTAIGFLPIGLANSVVGEFAGSIFWIVMLALVVSWFVAVVFTPYIGVKLLPNYKIGAHGHVSLYDRGIYRQLRRLIAFCIRRRYAVMAAMVGVFGLAIFGMVKVQKQFFPLSERPELFFEMRLPEGTSIAVTAATVAKAEKLLAGDEGIATYTSHIGQSSPRFWLGLMPALPNSAFAQIVIVARDVKTREMTKARLEKAIADGALAEARVRIDRFNFGPPVGFPVQFKVIGPDAEKVRAIAREVRAVMRQNPHVIDPHLDWNERAPAIQLVVAQDRARAMGLTPQDLAESLQTLVSGVTVTSIRAGSETIDIVARAAAAERLDLARLGDLSITTRGGAVVTVSQIADVKEISEEPILWRRNRDMEISVRADIVDGVQAPDVTMAIWPRLERIRGELPPGYRLEIGGAVEESEKANASIYSLFPLMIGLMMLLLMMQLQSFTKLFLVVMSAPLGLIGASLALNLADKPFGFIALLGLIALSGMDMRNSVILVDQVQHDIDRGLTYREAIIESIVRRARPVVLTALTAILAMIPLSRSAFWGPMAFTVMGGLFVATLLTLMFLPALYAIWFRHRLDSPNPVTVPAAMADPTMPARPPAMAAAPFNEPSLLPVEAPAPAARRVANDAGVLPLRPLMPRPLAAE